MKKLFYTLIIVLNISSSVLAEGFDMLQPANPFRPSPVPENSLGITVKKATLTQNNLRNQFVIGYNKFLQSNIKSAYSDFDVLINSMTSNDYGYMQISEKMADIGFFNLSDLAISKIEDKSLSDFWVDDIKLYYYPSKKLSNDDEMYLGEVYSNIVYNDQSKEATAELVKDTTLLRNSDYANYVASLGYLKSGDIINAEIYINTAIKMNQQNLNYKKLKAEILAQTKKPQNALKLVEYIKSQKLYTTDFEQKINSLEQYILYKSKKNYSEKMYHLGYYYYFEKEYAKSVRSLQNAFSKKKKHNKDVYAVLSRVYFDTQDYEKAQDYALKAYKIDSHNPIALLVLGDLKIQAKDYKSALKYYKEAEATEKRTSIPAIRVAQTYEKLDKQKKAIEIYQKVLKTYNDCYIAYYKIALTDKSREVAYLKKAIAINLNYKDAWIDLGRISLEKEQYAEAKKYLTIANYIDENDFRYYYYQGLLAKKQGLEASSFFKKSLSLNPNYEPAKEELNL